MVVIEFMKRKVLVIVMCFNNVIVKLEGLVWKGKVDFKIIIVVGYVVSIDRLNTYFIVVVILKLIFFFYVNDKNLYI